MDTNSENLDLTTEFKRMDIALGNQLADVVFKNATYFNPFTREFSKGDIAVSDGIIAGIGNYSGVIEHDMTGLYLTAGLIDSHIHFESSMVTPDEYARAVVPRGVLTVIADPHEVANVDGIAGVEFLLRYSKTSPLNIKIMMPSCVPASPYENSGAALTWPELKKLLAHDNVIGLGEMMDFPAVVAKDPVPHAKLKAAKGMIIDGHAPFLSGKGLNAYIAAGVQTDHECSTLMEMGEKLALGMNILIREGTGAKNADLLLQGVNQKNLHRVMFCTDDHHPSDLLAQGTVDHVVNLALKHGFSMADALLMATFNPARTYQLDGVGAIAPGYRADLAAFDSLEHFTARAVYIGGALVAEGLKPLWETKPETVEQPNSVKLFDWTEADLKMPLTGQPSHVLGLRDNDLTTDLLIQQFTGEEFSPDENYAKLVLMERHHALPLMGKAILKGYGIQNGAVASTVAHDAHNLIIAGDNDRDILLAMAEIKRIKGGIVLVAQGEVIGCLPLPILGLMTGAGLDGVSHELAHLEELAHDVLKINPRINPFLSLSFLALPVIPDVKITCRGLYSLTRDQLLPMNVE